MFKFIIATDIKQIYRKILVTADDRLFQVILSREQPQDSIQAFKLNTVTYTSPSSFRAIRTLHQLVKDEGSTYPLASEIIMQNTFVDDILFGSEDIEDPLCKRQDLEELLAKGQFKFMKWKANVPYLFRGLPFDREISFHQSQENPDVKLLGIKWNHLTDDFKCDFISSTDVKTNRQLLSQITRLFDLELTFQALNSRFYGSNTL